MCDHITDSQHSLLTSATSMPTPCAACCLVMYVCCMLHNIAYFLPWCRVMTFNYTDLLSIRHNLKYLAQYVDTIAQKCSSRIYLTQKNTRCTAVQCYCLLVTCASPGQLAMSISSVLSRHPPWFYEFLTCYHTSTAR